MIIGSFFLCFASKSQNFKLKLATHKKFTRRLVVQAFFRVIINPIFDKSEEDTRYKQNFELATIEVKDTMVDHTAPLLKNISIESKEVFMGQDIVLHLDP